MFEAASDAVQLPAEHGVELLAFRIVHKPVELRAPLFRAGDAGIRVLTHDLPSAARNVVAQLSQLQANVLAVIRSADSRVDCCFHGVTSLRYRLAVLSNMSAVMCFASVSRPAAMYATRITRDNACQQLNLFLRLRIDSKRTVRV